MVVENSLWRQKKKTIMISDGMVTANISYLTLHMLITLLNVSSPSIAPVPSS